MRSKTIDFYLWKSKKPDSNVSSGCFRFPVDFTLKAGTDYVFYLNVNDLKNELATEQNTPDYKLSLAISDGR